VIAREPDPCPFASECGGCSEVGLGDELDLLPTGQNGHRLEEGAK